MSDHNPTPKTFWWQNKRTVIAAVVVLVAVAALIVAAYTFHWGWTGLIGSPKTTITTEITQPSNTKKVTTTIEDQPGKTLWDWLQVLGVLAIPIVVGFGTVFFTRQQAKTSEANAENQQQEELLRIYFDKMSYLLLDKEPSTDPKIQSIIRARTLAALHILNTERKALVLQFLEDSGLLQNVKGFLYRLDLSNINLNSIDLSGANLSSTNLSGANLGSANLRDAWMPSADLSGADLYHANLRGAELTRANLSEARLSYANLSEARLSDATLSGADLFSANLSEARLSDATLSGATLSGATLYNATLSGATLSGAKLYNATLSGADLSGADLSGADLSGTKLYNADLSDATLRGANLAGADLSGATLIRAKLYNATLSYAILIRADLGGVDLSGATLRGAVATLEQFTEAKNVTPEQLAQIKSAKSAVAQGATAVQPSTTLAPSERKPNQMSQEEAEQQEHIPPKQDTDAAH